VPADGIVLLTARGRVVDFAVVGDVRCASAMGAQVADRLAQRPVEWHAYGPYGLSLAVRRAGRMLSTRWIAEAIADYAHSESVGSRLRARRIVPLLDMIRESWERTGSVAIIDVGGTEEYWRIVPPGYLDAHNVSVTLVNLSGRCALPTCRRFTVVEGDGCDLSLFGDCSFDIAHSNSVVEHVGDWERMVSFAREIARVAPTYFVQTPYYWFPIEPHSMTPFLHWLPRTARVWLVLHLELGHWPRAETHAEALRTVDSARLLTRRAVRALFAADEIKTERFWFLPKSLIALKYRQGPPD
jgi:hypothetical protein